MLNTQENQAIVKMSWAYMDKDKFLIFKDISANGIVTFERDTAEAEIVKKHITRLKRVDLFKLLDTGELVRF